MKASELEQLIFQALGAGEAPSLELHERIGGLLGRPLSREEISACYRHLRRLVDEGRLHVRETEPLPERGGRPRFYYRTPWVVIRTPLRA
jgi:hypothetical protein